MSDRWYLAWECTLVLFACSAGPACYEVWRSGMEQKGGYALVVGVPASAALIFLLMVFLVPNLIPAPRLKFPLQLTLPIVFCALMPVASMLWTSTSASLVAPQRVTEFAQVWQQPRPLITSFVFQALVLTLLTPLRRNPPKSADG